MNPDSRKKQGIAELPARTKLRAKVEPPKNNGAKWKISTYPARKKRRPLKAGSESRRALGLVAARSIGRRSGTGLPRGPDTILFRRASSHSHPANCTILQAVAFQCRRCVS